MQLSMLKQLLSKKLINETEYQVIQKKINERLWYRIQHYCLTVYLYCIII
ncbi:MAG: SHOCT domain-containing protein [Mediterraneibacter faecis]